MADFQFRNYQIIQAIGGVSSGFEDYFGITNQLGLASSYEDADGHFVDLKVNVLTIGAGAGLTNSSVSASDSHGFQLLSKPITYARVKLNEITNVKIMVGWISGGATLDFDTSPQHLAWFIYDTSVHTGAYWRTQTDASTGSPTQQEATETPVFEDQVYNLKIDGRTSGRIIFSVNDIVITTHTTNLPSSTTYIFPCAGVIQHTAANPSIRIGKIYTEFGEA